jgi:hypothetical protein
VTAPQTCSRCGQEVRYGKRGGITGWLHREDVDHMPIFGGPLWTPELQARLEASLAEMAARGKADKKKDSDPTNEDDGPDVWDAIPEPEVRCTDVPITDLRPRSGILQMVNLINRTDGWTLKRITYARGPWVGARGQVLSISDHHKVSALGPVLDTGQRFVVASWRDMEFKTGYVGVIRGRVIYPEPRNSNDIKTFIKEPP